jgi:DNA invertase Pin-like site-specific DNA recombinase
MSTTYFYARVSTIEQNTSRQIESFKRLENYDPINTFIDKCQGNIPFKQRKSASKLLLKVKPLDTIVVDSIDRLGRDLIDILKTVEELNQEQITVKVIKENLTLNQEDKMSKAILGIMGSIAQMERDRIKERQAEGIAIAKAEGKYSGRKIGSTDNDDKVLKRHYDVVKRLKKGFGVRDTAEVTGKSTATVTKVKKILASL